MSDERLLLRNSERKTWRRCRQKWWWNYVDCLAPLKTKDVLAFGTLVHAALEEWYKPGTVRGTHPARAFEKLFDNSVDHNMIQWDEEGERLEARELGVQMLEAYVEQWGEDPHLEVIWPEYPFSTDIFMPKKSGGQYLSTLVGRFDLVFYNHVDGRYWLSDHKTAKQIKTDHLQLDDQAGGYILAATHVLRYQGILGKDEEIAGVMYNYLRKGKPDDRPKDEHGRALNKDGSVSKKQPAPLFHRQHVYRSPASRKEQLKRLRKEAYEIRQARDGQLPIYKNATSDCTWDCPFFDVCVLHEEGGDWREVMNQLYEVWDPYDTEDRDLLNVAKIGA